MISRSDGRNYHLLLADRPHTYPAERGVGPVQKISACFWYVYGADRQATKTSVVLFEDVFGAKANVFRQIEFVADILADELLRRQRLAVFYNMQGRGILELGY